MAQDDQGFGQRKGSRIIDDTTKQVYGPKTSRFYFEEDVFYNRAKLHYIDTVISQFHRYNYVQRNGNFSQDLGNIGTSIQPIFIAPPAGIGATSGFRQFDMYWDDERIKSYDTKSPYSNMRVILGGKGRSLTRATFSRNINPRWNFGFTYRGMFVDKQIQRQSKGDRNVKSNYYDIFTSFLTKDSTYRLFFNFRRSRHETSEYGGVRTSPGFTYEDYFDKRANPSLTEAFNRELRMNIHLFHQFEIGKALQLYHVLDRYRQGNAFDDNPAAEPKDYFDYTEIDTAYYSSVKFKYLRNEVGVKGNLSKLFYNGYYAVRDISMTYDSLDTDTLKVPTNRLESYIGGRISLFLDSLVEVTGWAELLDNGNYRIQGGIKSRWFEAYIKQLQYAPSFLQQAYRGPHDVWSNDFDNTNITQINGFIHYQSDVMRISPGLTFTRMGNYVFFKKDDYGQPQTVLQVQTSGEQVWIAPELRFSFTVLKHIFFRSQFVYTRVLENAGDALQLPDLFVNAELSYENIFFNKNLDMQAGIDLNWKSPYFAMGYDVPVQQFYVQQEFQVPDFPIVDVFFSSRIKRGRIFIKYNNLIQLFTQQGYMPTPHYPGQRNVFDFGFDWSFYD